MIIDKTVTDIVSIKDVLISQEHLRMLLHMKDFSSTHRTLGTSI